MSDPDRKAWIEDACETLRAVATLIDTGQCDFDIVPVIHTHNLYLIASHLYYIRGISIFSDATYDRLCKWLLDHYDEVYYFIWWPEILFDKEALQAGTGYDIDYPEQILLICDYFQEHKLY